MARELSAEETGKLRVVQCAVRCGIARRELRQLRAWFEEEQKWRQALKRRRARIERLERELRHVENMPALDVDRYAATARYGMRGVEAAVQTIQGAWRSLLRKRRRQRQRRERQNRAAEVLQRFFRKYPKLRKTRLRHEQLQSRGATPKKQHTGDQRRPRDETPWELPSVQVVRAMQAKVTAHLEAWRKAGGMQRPRTDQDLEDLSQRAKSRFAEFQSAMAASRREYVARSQMRQETAECYMALRDCHGLERLEKDSDLEACAKAQRNVLGVAADKEYTALVQNAAHTEHVQLLEALTKASTSSKANRRFFP